MPAAVSVIIPVYGRAESLRAAIGSVLAQSFPDFELIVVDDGSGPEVAQAITGFDDQRIKTVRHDTRQGAAAARNTGIGAAQGDLVAFLDSDDEWLPHKLESQVRFLRSRPSRRACVSGVVICDLAGGKRVHVPSARHGVADLLDVCDLSPGSTLLVERSLFCEAGLFDTTFARFEDWDWLLRCLELSYVETVKEPLACIHVGNWPRLPVVRQAARQLLAANHRRVRDQGFKRYLLFRSSLFYEIAVAGYMQRSLVAAGFYMALSILFCPLVRRGIWRRLTTSRST